MALPFADEVRQLHQLGFGEALLDDGGPTLRLESGKAGVAVELGGDDLAYKLLTLAPERAGGAVLASQRWCDVVDAVRARVAGVDEE